MDNTEETRTVRDPFLGVDAVISNRLTDRLRGKYACGPTLPNGEPEFGWRENWAPPIQHEAAARIETLEADVSTLTRERDQAREALELAEPILAAVSMLLREDRILVCRDEILTAALQRARSVLDPEKEEKA